MARYLSRSFLLMAGALFAACPPAHAGTTVSVVETVEEVWVDATPLLSSPAARDNAIGTYGPFRIIAPDTIEMVGTVDSYSPQDFRLAMANHPGIRRLVMVECPGSIDDEANLELARLVRGAGLATHVPSGGSVRSGAVELFLAGVRRTAAPDAEFAVHSWQDEDGLGPSDYPASAPVNREYIDYYREMGLSPARAQSFYALTNSVPFEEALRLTPRDLAAYGLIDGDLALDLTPQLLAANVSGG